MNRSLGWFAKEGMSDDELRHALAHELGIPFIELGKDDFMPSALMLVPEPLAREHNVVAYRLTDHPELGSNALEVALLDMHDLEHIEFLRARYRLLPRLTTKESMTKGLLYYQRHLRDVFGARLQDATSPVLFDALLQHALHSRATDVHLQSDEGGLLVRYRINNALKDAMMLGVEAGNNVLTKLRALSGIASGVLPREGKFRVDIGSGEDVSVRLTAVPTVAGEKVVLHLTREKARRGHTLESLGLHGEALEAVHALLLKRRGLLVVEGERGSGVSTLLYTLMDILNTPELSIASVERSVEYRLPRVAQTDVTAAHISMAAALRAALKQDCDVVLIHDLDEREAAAVASAAAERGVLVLVGTPDASLFGSPDLLIKTNLLRRIATKQMGQSQKLLRAQADRLESGADFTRVLAVLKEEGRVAKDTAWKDLLFLRPTPSTEHPDGFDGWVGVQEVVRGGSLIGLNIVEDALYKAASGLTTLEEAEKLL